MSAPYTVRAVVRDDDPARRGLGGVPDRPFAGPVVGSPRMTSQGVDRGEPTPNQPSMRCWVQNEVRSVVVAAWAAALNSAVVETPYQCEVA